MLCFVRLVVCCPTAIPITHPLDVALWAGVDGFVVEDGREMVHCLAVMDNLPHGSTVGLVGAPSAIAVVRVL